MRVRTMVGAGLLAASALASLLALKPDDVTPHAASAAPSPTEQAQAATPEPLFPTARDRRAIRRRHVPGPAAALPGASADPTVAGELPPGGPPVQLPDTPAELRDALLRLSASTTPDGVRGYADFVDALRTDRELAAELMHEALAEMPPDAQRGEDGRRLIHAMGEVADSTSLPVLAELATRPLPPVSEVESEHVVDPHQDAAVAASMALKAMVKVVERTREPAAVATLHDTLQAILADPEGDAHVTVTASLLLRAHADDPAAEQLRQEQLLGPDRAWVARVEARTSLPPTAD